MSDDKYCFNCDAEAVTYIEWRTGSGEIARTFMCLTCYEAFQFGQANPETSTFDIELLK